MNGAGMTSGKAADGVQEGAETQAGDEGAAVLSRRAKVRQFLIRPLLRDGLIRPRAVTVADHEAFLEKLADRLGYLDQGLLVTLAEMVLARAEGRAHNEWPAFVTIWRLALTLRRPPDDERHIMTTWLRSRAGPPAREAGHLVELHAYLRKHGCPPNDYAMKQIRDEAADNARTRARIAADVQAGRARPSDVDWLNGYLSYLAYCEALVGDGEAARTAAPAPGQGEAA